MFKSILDNKEQTGSVISCGGGIVETQKARELLSSLSKVGKPVIWFQRDIEDIAEYLLKKDGSRPSFTEHPRDVFARRYPTLKNT